MNARKPNDPRWIGVLHRVYSGALWLYPPSHRKRWGEAMRQAFRDRCREAVRGGRGPLNVLFAELLPDLAKTVGSEHVDAIYLDANPMKRLLYVLIATFVAVVMLHSQITPALDKAHDWWRHREDLAYDRAYSAHLEALAQATEQARHDAHDDVTAAILYWNATSGSGRATYWDTDHGDGKAGVPGSLDAAANNALRDHADAAFARALKTDDRWALWIAVLACPARPAVCAKDASLARLQRIDADNGAVWLFDMQSAEEASDRARARAALARLARSTRFDTHDGDAMRALLLAFEKAPVPPRLVVDNAWVHATPTASASLLASALANNGYLYTYPNLKPVADYCRAKDAQIHAERQADCRAAGKLMAEKGPSGIGYHAWMRNADPGEIDQVRAAFREESWLNWGSRSQMVPLNSEAAINAWKAAWLAGGNAFDADRRLMQRQGIALNAPASFQLRPEQYDPVY